MLVFTSCGEKFPEKIGEYTVKVSKEPTNYVAIVMKDGGAMLIELYPDQAPETVQNFKNLVSEKYYDGVTFHRVISNFMIQGGDPDGDGYSNHDKPNIKGEFLLNGFNNTIKHERGVISMARSGYDYNSASTQFFIVHKTSASNSAALDGQYAAFGKMLAGFETLDKIATTRTNASNDKPVQNQTMKSVRFVTIEKGE
jgi:cyclophilin family peptidyl-prolyl cis-trans isomerase